MRIQESALDPNTPWYQHLETPGDGFVGPHGVFLERMGIFQFITAFTSPYKTKSWSVSFISISSLALEAVNFEISKRVLSKVIVAQF